MPKLKTSKTAVKRLAKVSGTGKRIRRKLLAQHLVHRKSTRSIKNSGRKTVFSKSDLEKINILTPYRHG